MSCIYLILNTTNNKYYIGSAIDLDERWRLHLLALNNNNHHNRHLQRAWQKYGQVCLQLFVLECTDDLEAREQYWIDKLDACDRHRGYNICKAGRNRHGVKASEETRKRLSESHKGHKHSEETKAKMSAMRKGKSIASKGRKQTSKHKAAIRQAKLGHITSEETKEKIRQAHLGRKASEETRAKQSVAAKLRWQRETANDGSLDYTSDMWV